MDYPIPVFRTLKQVPEPEPAQSELIPPLVDLPSSTSIDDALKHQVKLRRAQLKRLAFERAEIDKQVKAVLAEIANLDKIRRRRAERRYYPKRKPRGPRHQEAPTEHQP